MNQDSFGRFLERVIPDYQSSLLVKDRLSNIRLVAINGPSGVGKTTIMKELGIPLVVSDTTRPARQGEVEGVDYYFRTDLDVLASEISAGDFVQVAFGPQGDFKGTKIDRYPQSGDATMAIVTSAMDTFFELGFREVVPVCIVPPTFKEWQARIADRTEHSDLRVQKARFAEAKQSLTDALADERYAFICNDILDSAVSSVRAVLAGSYDHKKDAATREVAVSLLEQMS